MKRRDSGPLLGRIDASKRDFVRKLALGTAYAVPTISTFSLDGMRNKAHAQGTYVPPAVLGLGIVPGSSGAVSSYVDVGRSDSLDPYSFVITFNRVMDATFDSAMKYVLHRMYSPLTPPCGTKPTGGDIPAPPAGCPGGTGLNWKWNSDRTKQYAAITSDHSYVRLFLWLNHSSCPESGWYRDPNGELLEPFFDIADLCFSIGN